MSLFSCSNVPNVAILALTMVTFWMSLHENFVAANERCEPCGFKGVCACCSHDFAANLPEIDCQGRNLMEIPSGAGEGGTGHFFANFSLALARKKYTDFNAERNRIRMIRLGDFNEFADLRIIRLTYNDITYVEPGSFATTIFLDELDLSHNKLGGVGAELTAQTFDGLKFLKKLILSHNSLCTLTDILVEMPFLEEIWLDHNPQLLHIAEPSFKHSTFLTLIDLSVTQIGRDGSKFSPILTDLITSNLKILNVSYGSWHRSLPDLSNVSSSLEVLDISGNPIDSVDFQRGIGLGKFTTLRQLYIRDMDVLESIPPNLMNSMLNLETLIISDCPRLKMIGYQNLEVWTSDPLYRVEEMVVRNTSILTLENNSLPFAYAKHADLGQNPWLCDCNLRWMLGLRNIANEIAIHMRCQNPENLRSALIMTLHDVNLTCPVNQITSQRSLTTVKVLVFVTIFALLAFTIYTGFVIFRRISLRYRKPSFSHPLIEDASPYEKDPFLEFEKILKNSSQKI